MLNREENKGNSQMINTRHACASEGFLSLMMVTNLEFFAILVSFKVSV